MVVFLPGNEAECLIILQELSSVFVGKPVIALIPSAEAGLTNIILDRSLGEIQEEQAKVMTLLKERNFEMLSLIR